MKSGTSDVRLILGKYDLIAFMFAFTAFVIMSPYFVWSTYSPLLSSGLGIGSAALSIGLYLLFSKQSLRINREDYKITVPLFLLLIINFGLIDKYNAFALIAVSVHYMAILVVASMPREMRNKTIRFFIVLFTISLLPGMLVYLCSMFGISIPKSYLANPSIYESMKGKNYYYSLLSVVIIGKENRLCAMFDEPGVVGTICAILLYCRGYKFKRNLINIILLVAGVMSYSLAFFLLMVIGILETGLMKHGSRKARYYVLIALGFAIMLITSSNSEWLSIVFSRLSSDSSRIFQGYNRASMAFSLYFTNLVFSNPLSLIWGHGWDSILENYAAGGSDFRIYIYRYGLISFALMLIWVYQMIKRGYRDSERQYILLFFILILASVIQRPIIVTLYYSILLLGNSINDKGKPAVIEGS